MDRVEIERLLHDLRLAQGAAKRSGLAFVVAGKDADDLLSALEKESARLSERDIKMSGYTSETWDELIETAALRESNETLMLSLTNERETTDILCDEVNAANEHVRFLQNFIESCGYTDAFRAWSKNNPAPKNESQQLGLDEVHGVPK